jgi:hypothetical protein
MGYFAKWWAKAALESLFTTWDYAYSSAILTGDSEAEYYAALTKDEIIDFEIKLVSQFAIDTAIFT